MQEAKANFRDNAAEEKMARDFASAGAKHAHTHLPQIDFSMFIFSLNSSVLMHLGIIDDPSTGQKQKNLPAAKQTIDLLKMMEEKTRGNLNQQEEEMLHHILYDLRMIYVREAG